MLRIYVTATRYYAVGVQYDLFGEPCIVRSWGGRFNRLGGAASEPFSRQRMRQIERERRAHGYQRIY